MRSFLLLICIAAITSSNAQEKKLFNIKKYLQDKQAEKIKNARTATHLLPKKTTNCWGAPIPQQQKRSKPFILPNGDRVITNPQYLLLLQI